MRNLKYLIWIIPVFFTGCSGYKYAGDNLGEELIEEAIEQGTGIDIDLSQGSKEHGFNPKSILPFKKDPPQDPPCEEVKKK